MNKTDAVYLLQEVDGAVPTGVYKIGFTSGESKSTRGSTTARVNQYRAGNMRPILEYLTIRTVLGTGQSVERQIHVEFAAFRKREPGGGSEWFLLNDEQLAKVVSFMKSHDISNSHDTPVVQPVLTPFHFKPEAQNDLGYVFPKVRWAIESAEKRRFLASMIGFR